MLAAPEIAAVPTVVGLMWGAEDLIVSLGGRSSRSEGGEYLDVAKHARSRVLLAAGSRDKAMLDAVVLNVHDDETLRHESADAARSGFLGKACIHPRQVEVVREAFRPSDSDIEWAHRVVAAASDSGLHVIDGQMVDEPLLRQARAILSHV